MMNNFKLIFMSLVTVFYVGNNAAFAQSPMMNSASQGADMMQMHQQMMMQKLGPADKNYDLRFIDMMIIHHQGAVNMAQDALQKAQHTELKEMAKNIINSQTKEIEQMKCWRKEWYGQ